MANEITQSLGLRATNLSSTGLAADGNSNQFDMASGKDDVTKATMDVLTASYTAIDLGAITLANAPCIQIINNSATAGNYLLVSFDGGSTAHLKIPPNKAGVSIWPDTAISDADLMLKFATANGKAEIAACESNE